MKYFIFITIVMFVGCANPAKEYIQNGVTFYNQEQYQGALQHLERAKELDPKIPEIYFHEGNIYRDWDNRYEEAIASYTTAVKLNSKYIQAYSGRALLYRFQSEHDKALADYNKIIQLSPDNARAYYNRSVIYEQKYDSEKAIKYLTDALKNAQKAIEFDQESPEFHRHLAILLKKDGKVGKAIKRYNMIITLAPENLYYLMERGILYFEMENFDKAFQDLRDARGRGLEDPRASSYMSKIKRMKNWEK